VQYIQAGEKYSEMSKKDRERLIGNIAVSLTSVDEEIQRIAVVHFTRADNELGLALKRELCLDGGA
jgi:catalase